MSDWFEKQYADPASPYSRCYRYGVPRGAIEENQFSTDYAIAVLGLHPVNDTVLELGAGMGYVLDSWERRGFRCHGVEISPTAAGLSERRNITVADALSALRMMPDGAFTCGYTSQFLEHVPLDGIKEMLPEMERVAPLWAHYIAHEVGDDPSHVTILGREEWIEVFSNALAAQSVALAVPNPLYKHFPLYVHSAHGLPNRVRRALMVKAKMESDEDVEPSE